MDLGLAGANVVVSGGTKGMGLAAAQCFADDGANVAVLARGQEGIDTTVEAWAGPLRRIQTVLSRARDRLHLAADTSVELRDRGGILLKGILSDEPGTGTFRVGSHGGVRLEAGSGWADLFIYDPFRFQAIDAMVTNFHLPRSTLLMLVSAFAGLDRTRRAYRAAIREGYRFYSYGDAMLILRGTPAP